MGFLFFPIWVWSSAMTTDQKINYDAETNTSDVEKIKMKQTTCNWTKRILNEASRIVNF